MSRCPYCKAEVRVKTQQEPDNKLSVYLEEVDSKENLLLRCLLNFWRCRGEGNLEYAKKQYYYDPYHRHIEYHGNTDSYGFCIQVYDSPEGDTWIHGEFELKGGFGNTVIEILEEHSSSSAFS